LVARTAPRSRQGEPRAFCGKVGTAFRRKM